ncbi:lysylphosphatidylglycerol synthase domain-containing protein [Oceanicoccus sp. KOV_DT_Chl]|uniref:lysylphosphatidylglycerol synthase domain-containing protein n=1 Tax=Oceanicoccus sp. KOV_DT_Chl TaxID=1904639 RepID=UPI000C7C5285|nr:lysylphosphatidylglycerol synthase domain-containing protein [Oceanicoccus sp. KOV_DT_Chl]
MNNPRQPATEMSSARQWLQSNQIRKLLNWILPFTVSAALLSYTLSGIDIAAVYSRITVDQILLFIPALLIFLGVSLLIEGLCLVSVVSQSKKAVITLAMATKIKAASYLLGLINYAIGAGALSFLLHRRAGLPLADAAGAVFIIGLFDLSSLIILVSISIMLTGGNAIGVQVSIVLMVGLGIIAGFVVLRAPLAMGIFDRVRHLNVFSAARTLPIKYLVWLVTMRMGFVFSYILLTWSILEGFDIQLPWITMAVYVSVLLFVTALPIAAAGLGTGQLVFVTLFSGYADKETLLAASFTLSIGLIIARLTMGLIFAREYSAEALSADRL